MRVTIARKLNIVFSFLVIAIILVISFFAYKTLASQIFQEIVNRLSTNVIHTMQIIDRTLFERLSDMALMTSEQNMSLVFQEVSDPEAELKRKMEYLRDIEKNRKVYASMSLYDTQGVKLGDTRGILIGVDESKKSFFKGAIEGRIYADPRPVLSQSLGVAVIHFSGPLKDIYGNIRGVLTARFPIGKLHDILRSTLGDTTEGIEVDLVDHEGLILFSNHDQGNVLKQKLAHWDRIKERVAKDNQKGAVSFISQDKDIETLFVVMQQKGYLDFKGNDWTLVASVNTDLLFKPVHDLTRKFFLIGLFLILLTIPFVLFLSRAISRPLSRLTRVMGEMGKGDFNKTIDIKTNDEIGELAKAFNAMVDNLKRVTASRDELNREIKEREEAQHALRSSEERSRSILETANDAFIAIDAAGRIIEWNRKAEVIFGWSHNEVVGKNLDAVIIPHKYREAHKKGMQKYFETGEGPVLGKTIELTALRRNDNEFPIEITIWPLRLKDTQQFNAFVRDITQRHEFETRLKRANEELLENEKVIREAFLQLQKTHEDLKQTQTQLLQSEKLASIGQLAAGIAHEINNPVGFINSNLQTLEQYLASYARLLCLAEDLKAPIVGNDVEKAKAVVQEINALEKEINLGFISSDILNLLKESKSGIERIRKIVLDLRTFARVDADAMESAKIEAIIDSILSMIHSELKYKAELKKDYGDVPAIQCNPQKLGQVFLNLLVNAVQAIEQKGIILIKTYTQNGYICVDISDTGKGIKEEHLAKVFDAFFTTKPVGKGTGLGLSVSYDIVKKHGGEIKVKSEVGQGTTFTVMLPLEKKST